VSENKIMRECQIEVSNLGARVFRNNVGLLTLADGRKIRVGLCVGSSDLIGWKPITITPDMIGKQVAVFLAIEVKGQRGRVSREQAAFVEKIKNDGGLALIARSVDDVRTYLKD